ncbi:MAG TPA: hypothetical protein PK867_08855, partial [Pirellulales bacterium]|nr:hypothetical protein [Pirellulales bacterium]
PRDRDSCVWPASSAGPGGELLGASGAGKTPPVSTCGADESATECVDGENGSEDSLVIFSQEE